MGGAHLGAAHRSIATAVAIGTASLACGPFIGLAARAGRPAAQAVVVTGALFHPVDLGLYVVAVFRANAGNVPAGAHTAHTHRLLGEGALPEGNLCVAGGNCANQADDGHGTSHQMAQVGAGKHAESQCPVAGDESGVGFMVRSEAVMA